MPDVGAAVLSANLGRSGRANRVPSFGAKLKQQREQRGVTLEEISLSTKIGSRFLRALEDDRFDQLPGGIFNKGFVRAYARSVGIDEEEAIAGYLEAAGEGPDKPDAAAPLPELRAQAESGGAAELPWGALAIVLLIVALALVVWGFYSRQSATRNQPTTPATQRSSVPAPETAPAADSGSLSKTVTRGAAQQNISANVPAASDRKPTEKVSSASPQPINLQIKVREDSWMSIAADGKQIMRGTLPAASQQSVHATREIVVKAGNAGAVDFEFNGTKLPVQGNNGEVKTLIFDATGFHSPPPPPAAPSEQDSAPQPH